MWSCLWRKLIKWNNLLQRWGTFTAWVWTFSNGPFWQSPNLSCLFYKDAFLRPAAKYRRDIVQSLISLFKPKILDYIQIVLYYLFPNIMWHKYMFNINKDFISLKKNHWQNRRHGCLCDLMCYNQCHPALSLSICIWLVFICLIQHSCILIIDREYMELLFP